MLGPIFSIEMLTSARRSRYYLLRVLYAGILFFALFTTYTSTTRFGNLNSISQSANVAGNFFYSFTMLQILAVLMVGPAMAAGVIAVERERRTIEYLFATDLTNREIVIGKIVARLLQIGCLVLVGLPILALAMLMGGIAPEQLAAVFIVTLSTMIFVGVLAVSVSVWSNKVREAFTKTYLILFALLVVPGAMLMPMLMSAGVYHHAAFLINPLIAANPFTALGKVAWRGIGSTLTQMGSYFWEPVWELVLLQGSASLVLGLLATWAVRRVHLKEAGKAPAQQARSIIPVRRLRLGNHPMIWKERVAGRMSGKVGIAARIAGWLVCIGVLVPSIYWFLMSPNSAAAGVSVVSSNFIACAGLLVLAARAAGAITSEREKDTWTTLLSTPLSASEIVVGKLIGSLYSVRGLVVVLAVLWALQILRAPQLLVALPFTVGTLAVTGFFAATLGLNYSLRSSNSTRAMGATLATAVFVSGGYLFCCIPVMVSGRSFEQVIMAPCIPFLVVFPSIASIERGPGGFQAEMMLAYLFGVIGYVVAGATLYGMLVSQFDEKNGRIPE